MRFILGLAFLVVSVASASATCTSPAVMHDFPGTSFNMSFGTNPADGNCASVVVLPVATPSGIVAANSNNSTNLKASAGTVWGIQTSNINATTPYYLKLYDKATAPTCGTDTPVARFVIPPNFSGNNGVFPVGKKFTLGIGFCIVTGIADNDNTSVPAATILSNVDWN